MKYLYGKNALEYQIIINKDEIKQVHLYKTNKSEIKNLKNKGIKIKIHHDFTFFNNFNKNLNHQFIITELFPTNKDDLNIDDYLKINNNKKNHRIVILDSIEDPQNFGAILRTCEAFGINCVIYKSDNQVQINDFVIKTSMGAINNINLIKVNNISQTIKKLKENNFFIYASVLSDKAISINKINFPNKIAVIVGNEHKGISRILIDKSDQLIKIDMFGQIQSLNVSVACGILAYEITKKN